jgi:hypothetical protein
MSVPHATDMRAEPHTRRVDQGRGSVSAGMSNLVGCAFVAVPIVEVYIVSLGLASQPEGQCWLVVSGKP